MAQKRKPIILDDFFPMTRDDMDKLGWDELDVLLVTGDAYVDHHSYGITVIGRTLLQAGYRVGIVAQPDWKAGADAVNKMGRPKYACAVTSGNLDSMVNIYTAGRRLRRKDAYTPGGEINRRPPHATTVYSQLVRQAFPGIKVIIGGMEASLRRIAHYDYWQDKIRPSILVDSKADLLIYGMGELALLEALGRIEDGADLGNIRGSGRLLGKKAAESFKPDEHITLIDIKGIKEDKEALLKNILALEREMNPANGRQILEWNNDRLLVLEPPARLLSSEEMDAIYNLPFQGAPHPSYKETISAFETVRHSIAAIRGCPGGCTFCGLVAHQGKFVVSRTSDSIKEEVQRLTTRDHFRGTISDIGGAAGNLFRHKVKEQEMCDKCRRPSCLFPTLCSNYIPAEDELVELLKDVREMPKVKHVHINSGIRLDLALHQKELTKEMIHHHVSGHLKVAPEHLHDDVLKLMRKNPANDFYEFMKVFEKESKLANKEQYLIPLFISNFPGSTEKEMKTVDNFLDKENWSPQQVQDYIPLPMTVAAAMYYCGKTPDGQDIQVNRGLKERRGQINVLKKQRKSKNYSKGRSQNNKNSQSKWNNKKRRR
jgi:uncharacterized radical SAM protein YgiQ